MAFIKAFIMYCKLTYMGNSGSCTVHMHMVILVGVVSVACMCGREIHFYVNPYC